MTGRADFADRVAAVHRSVDLVRLIEGQVELRKHRGEYTGLCPFHRERTPSFTVVPSKGFYHCFGCDAHGDAIAFVQETEGLPFKDALEKLEGPQVPRPKAKAARPASVPARKAYSAGALLAQCQPGAGSRLERYLEARGIDLAVIGGIPEVLRFHPKLWHAESRAYWPAMVAAVVDAKGRVVGVHRTFLDGDSAGKAPVQPVKKMAGACFGHDVLLAPSGTLTVVVAEGIETGLSCLQGLRAGGLDHGVIAALSLPNLSGGGRGTGSRRRRDDPRRERAKPATWCLPSEDPNPERPGLLIPDAAEVIIAGETDSKDPPAYRAMIARAIAKYRGQGQRVTVAWPQGGDFNNELLRGQEA